MSDILIKGMKMPVACFDCPCMQDLSNIDEEYYICAAIEHAPEITNKNNGRLPKCPIVKVPTPHGRLIDADAVEKRLQKYWYEEYPNQEASYHRAFMDSNACVKDLPTIIEAEVSE